MKRKNSQSAIENHDISQRKYPMPGTDLGFTTAIPYNEAYDVDMSSGGHETKGPIPVMSFTKRDPARPAMPAKNPTRWE